MGPTLPPQLFTLITTQPVTNSTVLVTLGSTGVDNIPFSVAVKTGQRIFWEFYALFSLGATGGFRFQPTAPAGISKISTQWAASEQTTPADFALEAVTQTPFANAAAVAATYQVNGQGSFHVGATEGDFALQFAQNSATGNAINILNGAVLRVTIS